VNALPRNKIILCALLANIVWGNKPPVRLAPPVLLAAMLLSSLWSSPWARMLWAKPRQPRSVSQGLRVSQQSPMVIFWKFVQRVLLPWPMRHGAPPALSEVIVIVRPWRQEIFKLAPMVIFRPGGKVRVPSVRRAGLVPRKMVPAIRYVCRGRMRMPALRFVAIALRVKPARTPVVVPVSATVCRVRIPC